MTRAAQLKSIAENNQMEFDDFKKQVESKFKKIFPYSYINVMANDGIGSKYISISFTLLNKGDYPNNIRDNDPMYHILMLHRSFESKDSDLLKDRLELELLRGGSLLIKPSEGSHLAFDRVRIGFRKTKGDPAAIIKSLENYFKKSKKVLIDNKYKLADDVNKKYLA